MNTRADAKELIPGVLYQRGQILTWSLEDKKRLINRYGITMVVNFWSKVDPDMSNLVPAYLHFPVSPSKEIMSERISRLSEYVTDGLASGERALVLCEAGVTRSMYFCVLVIRLWKELSGEEALDYVHGFRVKLSSEMEQHIKEMEAPW